MWNINNLYNFTFILKNQISFRLIDLFKFYKIVQIKMIQILLKKLIRKIILDFKILIWEPRNKIQISREKRYNISSKDKKMKSNSINRNMENTKIVNSREIH